MEEPEEHASAEPEHHHSRERHSPRTYLTPYAPEPEGKRRTAVVP